VLVGLLLFVIALELLKKGATGVVPLLRTAGVEGLAGGLGAGWVGACVLLSGSPVAALSLTLLASGSLTTPEAFAMITGSRLGASFVVLVVGVLDDLRHRRREMRSAYVGVAALVATALTYLPAMALGYWGLGHGVFEGLRMEGAEIDTFVRAVVGPIVRLLQGFLPLPLLFLAGIGTLLLAFEAFDHALPDLSNRDSHLPQAGRTAYRPAFMFAIGLAVTAVTLSVSVSISLLVPLAARGYIKRENIVPYILGANITTFIDTLFAGALVGHPDAVRIVALLISSVSVVSLPVVFVFPYAFESLVDRVARRATTSTRAVLVFVTVLLLVPVLLIAL
jgi:Na+/phosphate symporter